MTRDAVGILALDFAGSLLGNFCPDGNRVCGDLCDGCPSIGILLRAIGICCALICVRRVDCYFLYMR